MGESLRCEIPCTHRGLVETVFGFRAIGGIKGLCAQPACHFRYTSQLAMRFNWALVCALLTSTAVFASGELSGRRAPGFSLPDMQLKYQDLADYRGKVVLIEIMQSTCPDCAVLAETLEKTKAKYGDKIAVLSVVNPPDTQATVSRFLQEHKVTYPILFDCGQVTASYFKLTPQNSSMHVPHLFVIDGQGMIRNDFAKTPDAKDIFEGTGLYAVIDPLLNPTAPKNKKK